jgi:hypothetical protein
MRKKSGFTMVEQAIVLVPEFEKVVHKLGQQLLLPRNEQFHPSKERLRKHLMRFER